MGSDTVLKAHTEGFAVIVELLSVTPAFIVLLP